MADNHTTISDYAEDLISVPRAHLVLEMTQEKSGMKLKHQNQIILECSLTRDGMAASNYIAKSLGIKIPVLGESINARVSTGVLFRAISIASLDFNNDQSFLMLDRLLEEAEMQRGAPNEAS